jgi:hypothetical protein
MANEQNQPGNDSPRILPETKQTHFRFRARAGDRAAVRRAKGLARISKRILLGRVSQTGLSCGVKQKSRGGCEATSGPDIGEVHRLPATRTKKS